MTRILITGKGGFGDMLPLFAVAKALKAKGHSVIVSAEAHHEETASSVEVPLLKLCTPKLSKTPREHFSPLVKIPGIPELMQTLSPSDLEVEYEQIFAAANESDIMVGNQLAYAGSLVRKKLEKPWIYCAVSPLAMPSRYDPPLFPYLHKVQSLSDTHLWTQQIYLGLARKFSSLMMSSTIRLQQRLGIKDDGHPRFEGIYSKELNLMMTSPVLLSPQPDWPAQTVVTGFSWLEPAFMKNESRSRELSEFFDAGPSPVVFAPGGIRRAQPKGFFTEGIKACALLGVRAIIVAAKKFHAELPVLPGVFITDYIPYAEVLGRASAIVHSGGIGTLGWSFRFGVPSLLVPACWDQYDNARRAFQKGLVMTLPEERYQARNIASALGKLLQDHKQRELLQRHKAIFAAEDGAAVACASIESLIKRRQIQTGRQY